MIKMCYVLDYHVEVGEKPLNFISTLYNFLTKTLLIFGKKPQTLIVFVFSYIKYISLTKKISRKMGKLNSWNA